MTLADLEGIALANSPSLAEAAARVEALRGKYWQVGLPFNPRAGYVAEDIGNEGSSGQQGAFVAQEVILGDKLRLNRAVAAQEVQRAEQQLAAQRLRLITDVRIGFYEVLIAQRRKGLTGELAKSSHEAFEATDLLYRSQQSPFIDVLQARIEAEGARILAENAVVIHDAAWRRLAAAVGVPGMKPADLDSAVDDPLPAITHEATLERLLTQSPVLGEAYANLARARWAIDRARAEVVPNADLRASVRHDNATGDTLTDVEVGLPIPIFNRNQGGRQQAEADYVAAQRAIERTELALTSRLATVFRRYEVARTQVDTYRKEILPKAKQMFDLVSEAYPKQVGYLQFLTAQRTYFQTSLAYLDALSEAWSASRELEGLLLTGSLESAPKE
ncbi:MAG: TolC family protein [Planctomycetia bacterium]|nr:TolC family protein [Planctomycetia bacterium]